MKNSGQTEISSTDFSLWGSEKTWQADEARALDGNRQTEQAAEKVSSRKSCSTGTLPVLGLDFRYVSDREISTGRVPVLLFVEFWKTISIM
jgi:hypothetical protein